MEEFGRLEDKCVREREREYGIENVWNKQQTKIS